MLHMDTASDLLWLQCRPCASCYPQNLPIYDSSRSYTYQKESCETSFSSLPSLNFDAETKTCSYSITYMDGSRSSGTLSTQTLTFNTISDGSLAVLSDVVLGCGHDNYVSPSQYSLTGVLGLGYGNLSLVHRFGSKFSYCFGSLSNPTYPHVLVIGDTSANILGDTTPLNIHNGVYYLELEAISVDGITLPIDPQIFQRDYRTGNGGTIIDTGSSLATLVYEAYDVLKNEIEDVLDGRFKPMTQHGKDLMQCYYGDFERDLVGSGFPIVTFHFSGGELSSDVQSLFIKRESGFCLSIIPNMDVDMSVIGAISQQNYNVGYDLEANIVSFEKIDCGVLFDY